MTDMELQLVLAIAQICAPVLALIGVAIYDRRRRMRMVSEYEQKMKEMKE